MGIFHHVHKPVFLANPEKYFSSTEAEKEFALKRYQYFEELFQNNHDNYGNMHLFKLKNSLSDYIERVVNFEAEAKAFKNGKITKEDFTSTDNARKNSHDALITEIKIFNRYCVAKYGWEIKGGIIPAGGIFSLDPDLMNNRNAVTKWAWLLVSKIFKKECKKAINAGYALSD